jgi:hypothetical protein
MPMWRRCLAKQLSSYVAKASLSEAVALMGGKGPTIIATREEAGITRVEDLRGKSISTIGFTRPKGRRCGHLPPCCARAVEKTLDAVQNELVLVRPLQRRPDLTQVSRIANRALRRGCGQYFQFGPN